MKKLFCLTILFPGCHPEGAGGVGRQETVQGFRHCHGSSSRIKWICGNIFRYSEISGYIRILLETFRNIWKTIFGFKNYVF